MLLRYGKTWTQEPEAVLRRSPGRELHLDRVRRLGGDRRLPHDPPAGAANPRTTRAGCSSTTARAGRSTRQPTQRWAARFRGPWPALPDGGAAVSAHRRRPPRDGHHHRAQLRRLGPWQAAPPYPGTEAPGSLALFREGGALRAVGSGGLPNTAQIEELPPPPAGFPPNLIAPYPLRERLRARARPPAAGATRNTRATRPQDPLGEYKLYDQVYQPDPSAAVLINEDGSEGWAVGGFVEHPPAADSTPPTSPATPPKRGSTPPGVRRRRSSRTPSRPRSTRREATFADRRRTRRARRRAPTAPARDSAPTCGSRRPCSQAQRVARAARLPLHGPARHERRRPRRRAGRRTSASSPATANCSGSAGALPVYPAPSETDRDTRRQRVRIPERLRRLPQTARRRRAARLGESAAGARSAH